MSLRAQPPVYSPLSARAIGAGIQAALAGGRTARADVSAALKEHYHPATLALTDSGTSALALALRLAVARRPGRPILLPAWACFDLATAVLAADVRVLFYDVDPMTLGPDWQSLETAAQHNPAGAVAVHFFGIPIDWSRFETVIRPTGATIIEDAAQAVGAEVGNRPAGSLGDLAILSFGRGKGTTGGRGGALLVNDPAFVGGLAGLALPEPRGGAGEAISLTAQWILTRPALFGLPAGLPWLGLGQTVFHPPHPISGLSALAAGVLGSTMPLAEAETSARRKNVAAFEPRLRDSRLELVRAVAGTRPGWLRMPARLKSGGVQAVGGDARARSLGIYPSYPTPLDQLPGMAERLMVRSDGFPGAKELTQRLLTLPTHSAVDAADLQAIIAWAGGTA